MAKLIDITGKAIAGEWGNDDDSGTGIPVLRTTNFTNDGVINYNNVVTRDIQKKDLSQKFLQPGDIIIEKSGGSDKQPVGRVVYYDGEPGKFLFNNFTGALRVRDKSVWYPRYIFYALYGNYAKGGTRRYENKTTGLHNLKTDQYVQDFAIQEQPLEYQRQIVSRLDKVTELIAFRKEQLAKLDQLVKSRFVEMFEKEEYKKVTVSSVLNTGFWLMPATPEFIVDGEVPYITSKNIKNRTIDFDNVKYISREAYKSISANRPTQKGDILISMIGTLGQTAVIQDDREFYGQNLYLLRLNNAIVNTTYFCEFFNSDMAQYELQGKRNQSTQAYLKANYVEDLILPLPPMELQEQFAAFVEQTDKSKLAIQQSLDKLELLKKSLMQEYFG